MPAVSVIMPAYNVAPYIGEAIDSVLRQTYVDLELLVIDDGSTDETLEIATRYSLQDPRVRILRQVNAGISSARNHGLRVASGGVIAILDSDDMWLPGYLAAQMAILTERPQIDIVTGNAWFLGSQRHGLAARPVPDYRRAPDLAQILAEETAVFIMSVFRRRVYETIGGFDEALRTNEDYDFWIRAAVAGFRFHRNDEPLGHYRRRDDSLSSSELRMVRGILCVFRKTRRLLLHGSAELAILDAQIARFENQRLVAEARHAIETGDFTAADDHLSALYWQRGGAVFGVARLMARWTPALLSKAYGMHRAYAGAAPAPAQQGRA